MKASQGKAEQSISRSACVMLFNKRLSMFHNVLLLSVFEAECDKFHQINV